MANWDISNAYVFTTFAFLILVCTPDLIFGQIRYSIPEEINEGAVVGNIAQDLGLNIQQLSSRRFRLTSDDGEQYMKVNLDNGILSIRKRIDRENVCGQTPTCTIHFKIILEKPLAVYPGEMEILDVNDNSPTFRESNIVLQISEAITPGVQFPLESAEDPDSGINTVAAYTLSSSEYFSIKTQRTEDDNILAKLLLDKPLDRERQTSFQLVLTATDGGTPQRSGTALILITVLDNNDNPPVFDHEIYRSSLRENTPVGTLVIKVKANDLDEGVNAELTYSFSKLTSPRIRELFSIDPDIGEIRTEGEVDFEEANSYSIDVQAVDHGSPAITGHSNVLIKVIDENDNAPEIKVTSGTSNFPENAPPGTLITLINVIDRDSGANGDIYCKISKNIPFNLQTSSKNHYELITSEPLDRESVPEYKINVIALDMGSPSLSSNKTIHIVLSDVNDNAPRFEKTSYNIYVMENNAPGVSIFAVTASDPDLGQNSYISYSILENLIHDFPISSYVNINSMNGSIYALGSFDYEQLKTFQIYIQARDAGVPPLSSRTTVNVIILDQNDNTPVIVSPSAKSGSASVEILPQSAGQGYLVTKIMATDADSGQNARLLYQLVKSTDPSLFNVGQSTGEIRTARNILMADTTTQTLVILVKDNGQPSLSSTVTIQITILENITERITESNNFVSSPENFSDLNLYLIVIFACTSVLFLVTILLLIGIKCKQEGNVTQQYNSPSCFCRRGESRDEFNRRSQMEETLRYPGTGRVVRVPEAHQYSVCLSPDSSKSEFLFLKPCAAPTPHPDAKL
ncbi:protocadherin gamma-C5-like [Pristis pectinata]|uniref:protocadherin gamma-C5-like n=1 Tax=Pristis pectinata TaxID=685728 RepID=UPI00223CF79F|nr:protocadherin gamma-C5-like [Pristis pectinata]